MILSVMLLLSAPALATHLEKEFELAETFLEQDSIRDFIDQYPINEDSLFFNARLERFATSDHDLADFIHNERIETLQGLADALKREFPDISQLEVNLILANAEPDMFAQRADAFGEPEDFTTTDVLLDTEFDSADNAIEIEDGITFTFESLRDDEDNLRDFLETFNIDTENEFETMLIFMLGIDEPERRIILDRIEPGMLDGLFPDEEETFELAGAAGVDVDNDGNEELVVVLLGGETRPATLAEARAIEARLEENTDILKNTRTQSEEAAVQAAWD